MGTLLGQFKDELLNADLDLGTSVVSVEGEVITVTSKVKPVHMIFALLFALPCANLLYYAARNPSALVIGLALVFCPLLLLMTLLLGFTTCGKSLNRIQRQAIKSIHMPWYSVATQEPLASQGTIALSWKWSKSGNQPKGYHKYTVVVNPAKGIAFVTLNNYAAARGFAEQLAAFLAFPLEDTVPVDYRR